MPEHSYMSEWLHTLGGVKYEYHMHRADIANALKKLYNQGVRGGNPRLTGMYSKRDLYEIICTSVV